MELIKSQKKSWFITLTGALFFFYAFFQVNMMGPLNQHLLQAFHANAAQVGLLSAFYFYANILFMIPAGLILDRYSIRKVFLWNMVIVIVGSIIFATASSLAWACLGRFLCGVMMSFGLIICLKLASLLLPPSRMALASSLIITIGMIGGIFSHMLMDRMIHYYGWREAVIGVAILGLIILAILGLGIRVPKQVYQKNGVQGIWKSLREVLLRRQNWTCGFFICFLNLPIAVLGALFGNIFLTQIYGIDSSVAASITSMLFFGMILGSPFFGWFSDAIKRRKLPMFLGAIFCLLLMLVFLYNTNGQPFILYILFFGIGFTSASQVLGYPVISESSPSHLTATSLSLASILIMGVGYGLGLPFVGWLMEYFSQSSLQTGLPVYSLATYQKAFLSIPIAIGISLIMLAFIKEPKGKKK